MRECLNIAFLFLCFVSFIVCEEERESKNILSSLIKDGISIWNDRIVFKPFGKKDPPPAPAITEEVNKAQKQLRICLTSEKEVGFCSGISDCPGFRLSRLHNNICLINTFVPGVCCSLNNAMAMLLSTPSKTTSTSDDESDRKEDNIKSSNTITKCGTSSLPSSRIVGGTRSALSEHGYMAAVFYNNFIARTFHCGGSLVTSQHVLTGAHCVKDPTSRTFSPMQISVRLGDVDLQSLRDKTEDSQFYSVKEIRAHPKFKNINQYFLNDVAILKLSREVRITDNVMPVCLPSDALVEKPLDYFHGRLSTVIGFGRTEKGVPSKRLLEAKVPIWKNNECDKAYFAPITTKFICAGYIEGGIDACQGDSGGPLLVKEGGLWVQIGITSFGKGCGEPRYPGVYTRLTSFLPWIKQKISY